ncbi:MAG: hypothetical protein WBG92_03190 [Thiohalocapsa sp.]
MARWLFSDGLPEQQDSIATLTLDGLRYLIDELSYDRERSEKEEAEILLRWRCSQLALAMAATGYDTDQTIVRLRQSVQDDPLPEVRHIETAPLARLQE